MQQYRNNRNNGNFYDLRKDLQHTHRQPLWL